MGTPHFLTLWVMVFCWCKLPAQEQLGMRLSNYAGVNSLSLNPAGHLSSPMKWDINLVGGGIFFENNYAFIQNTSTGKLLRSGDDAEYVLANDLEGRAPRGAHVVDFFDNGRRRFLHAYTFVNGPSFAFKVQDKHAFGVFTRFMARASAQRVPDVYSYYRYNNRAFFDVFAVSPFDGAAMSWSEVALNYALKLPAYDGSFGLGINLRFLQGYEGGYLLNEGTMQHTKLPDDVITLSRIEGRFGYASSNLEGGGPQFRRNGSGVALDLGVIRLIGETDDGYRLRLGASLLDLGSVRFNKNAADHRVGTDGTATLRMDDYTVFDRPEHLPGLASKFSTDVLGSSSATLQGDAFRLALPAALSLQADYSISPVIYLNGLLLQRFVNGNAGLKRGNLLAFTPRFEHRWFGASLPLSVYQWQAARVGLALRLGVLVIGTDDLLSWTGSRRYTGTDVYFALKIHPFDLDLGNGKGKRKGRKGRVRCYDF